LVEAFYKHMKSLRVSLRRSLDLKPVGLQSVKWAPSYCNHLINLSSFPALYCLLLSFFHFIFFFIYKWSLPLARKHSASISCNIEPVPRTHWFPRNGATRGFRIEI